MPLHFSQSHFSCQIRDEKQLKSIFSAHLTHKNSVELEDETKWRLCSPPACLELIWSLCLHRLFIRSPMTQRLYLDMREFDLTEYSTRNSALGSCNQYGYSVVLSILSVSAEVLYICFYTAK
jgi:hypothetical protein